MLFCKGEGVDGINKCGVCDCFGVSSGSLMDRKERKDGDGEVCLWLRGCGNGEWVVGGV